MPDLESLLAFREKRTTQPLVFFRLKCPFIQD